MRPASALALRERSGDATVSSRLIELSKFAGFAAVHSSSRAGEMPRAARGAFSISSQERPSVGLIHGAFWSRRSSGKAAVPLSVRPFEQQIEKEVASENAKRQE
jgi:G:T-mismatch repair DNA endonuclease (very short patch repair protein)